MARKENLAVW